MTTVVCWTHKHTILFTLPCSSAVMARCWCENPEHRPQFKEICSIMDQLLTVISDYTELRMVLVDHEEHTDVHGV